MNDTGIVLELADLAWQARSQDTGGRFSLEIDRLTIRRGELLALCGPSGCGKSTTLGLLSLALQPASLGRMALGGHDIAALWRRGSSDMLTSIRAQWFGFIPQMSGLLPFLSVMDNIMTPLRIQGRAMSPHIGELMTRLEIDDLRERMPSTLSVGQRQRVAIARALVHRPAIMLADEPTSALHPEQADAVMALLAAAAADGTAIMMVTHDIDRARQAGFRLISCETDPAETVTRFSYWQDL